MWSDITTLLLPSLQFFIFILGGVLGEKVTDFADENLPNTKSRQLNMTLFDSRKLMFYLCDIVYVITTHQWSWGKVMFSRVSVILYTGGMGMPDPRSLRGVGMPGPRSLLGVCILECVVGVYQVSVPSRGCSLWVGCTRAGTPPGHSPRRYIRRRCTSRR